MSVNWIVAFLGFFICLELDPSVIKVHVSRYGPVLCFFLPPFLSTFELKLVNRRLRLRSRGCALNAGVL